MYKNILHYFLRQHSYNLCLKIIKLKKKLIYNGHKKTKECIGIKRHLHIYEGKIFLRSQKIRQVKNYTKNIESNKIFSLFTRNVLIIFSATLIKISTE